MTEAASKTNTKIKAAKRFSLGAIGETVCLSISSLQNQEKVNCSVLSHWFIIYC